MRTELNNFCGNRNPLYICSPKGSLAQLVQSICLTSRGSGVRTPQLPHQNPTEYSGRCMNFIFYVLYSSSADRYYIGHTVSAEAPREGRTSEPIDERLRKHNSHHKGFTGKFDDWKVLYTERFATKSEAYQRELQVKSWKNRRLIEKLTDSRASDRANPNTSTPQHIQSG